MLANFKRMLLIYPMVFVLYLLIGIKLPMSMQYDKTGMLVFGWLLGPLACVVISYEILKRFKVEKIGAYLAVSFALNGLLLIVMSLKDIFNPGMFSDLVLIVLFYYGIGQVFGIIYTLLYHKIFRKMFFKSS